MPGYTFYFVLPDYLAVLGSYVIGFADAFKLATVLGSVLMPVAYAMGRLFGARHPSRGVGAGDPAVLVLCGPRSRTTTGTLRSRRCSNASRTCDGMARMMCMPRDSRTLAAPIEKVCSPGAALLMSRTAAGCWPPLA